MDKENQQVVKKAEEKVTNKNVVKDGKIRKSAKSIKKITISKTRYSKPMKMSIYDTPSTSKMDVSPTAMFNPKKVTRNSLQRHISLIRAKPYKPNHTLLMRVLIQEEFEDKYVRLNQADYDSEDSEDEEEMDYDSPPTMAPVEDYYGAFEDVEWDLEDKPIDVSVPNEFDKLSPHEIVSKLYGDSVY